MQPGVADRSRSDGHPHATFTTLKEFRNDVVARAAASQRGTPSATSVWLDAVKRCSATTSKAPIGAAWHHADEVDVRGDDVWFDLPNRARIDAMTIRGSLQWTSKPDFVEYTVMESLETGEAFAGAAIAPGDDGLSMTCILLAPESRELGIHFVRLEEKHRNAIRRLNLSRRKRGQHER